MTYIIQKWFFFCFFLLGFIWAFSRSNCGIVFICRHSRGFSNGVSYIFQNKYRIRYTVCPNVYKMDKTSWPYSRLNKMRKRGYRYMYRWKYILRVFFRKKEWEKRHYLFVTLFLKPYVNRSIKFDSNLIVLFQSFSLNSLPEFFHNRIKHNL